MKRLKHPLATATALVAGMLALTSVASSALAQNWTTGGADLYNSRNQSAETKISTKTVQNLKLKWAFTAAGDVTATPAVVNGFVYVPDAGGFVYKMNAATGQVVWQTNVAGITGIAGDYSRSTPAVSGNLIILGSQSGKFSTDPNNPYAPAGTAQVFALNMDTGALVWRTQVDQTPQSFVTTSAGVANGTVIVGVASNEELTAAFVPPEYWTWHHRGSAVALDAATGAIKWKTYMTPEGYYGASIWGSTPAIDLGRKQVYVATGNNYMVPPDALTCLKSGAPESSCLSADNHADSIVALDLTTGAIKWAGRGMPDDAWSVACGLGVPGFTLPGPYFATPGIYGNCTDPTGAHDPNVEGPDWDFAQAPMMFTDTGSTDRPLVGAGSKSGVFWTFRAKDGSRVWSTQVSPGGVTGGMQWGAATNGTTIYVQASNAGPALNGGGAGAGPWTLVNGTTVTSGGWAAIDAASGKVLWTTPDPEGSRAEGAVTLANGVLFGCNMNGTVFALNAKNGGVLWQYKPAAASPCTAGASVSAGMVFIGSGNAQLGPYGPKTLYAFGL